MKAKPFSSILVLALFLTAAVARADSPGVTGSPSRTIAMSDPYHRYNTDVNGYPGFGAFAQIGSPSSDSDSDSDSGTTTITYGVDLVYTPPKDYPDTPPPATLTVRYVVYDEYSAGASLRAGGATTLREARPPMERSATIRPRRSPSPRPRTTTKTSTDPTP